MCCWNCPTSRTGSKLSWGKGNGLVPSSILSGCSQNLKSVLDCCHLIRKDSFTSLWGKISWLLKFSALNLPMDVIASSPINELYKIIKDGILKLEYNSMCFCAWQIYSPVVHFNIKYQNIYTYWGLQVTTSLYDGSNGCFTICGYLWWLKRTLYHQWVLFKDSLFWKNLFTPCGKNWDHSSYCIWMPTDHWSQEETSFDFIFSNSGG